MKRIRMERKRKNNTAAATLREQRDMLCDRLSFTAAESYKQLRANLLFALPDENKCRIVGVTSSIRGEGKSTTSVNTAYTLAETGKRTLLIDADMRLPSVAKKLAIAGKPGLSNLLAGMCTLSEAVHASPFMDNWQIMPAGDIPPNPSELLGSEQMENMLRELGKVYDFIVVDLPPVDIVSDALAISQWVNGIIVVVRSGYTDRRSLNECMRQLGVLKSRLLGFVMTDVEEHHKEYGKYGKKYYGHGYGYGYGYGYAKSGENAKRQSAGENPPAAGTAGEGNTRRSETRSADTAAPRKTEKKFAGRKTAEKKSAPAREKPVVIPPEVFDHPDSQKTEN